MEILSAVGIIVAAVVGFILGKKNSSNEIEKNRLEQQLKEKTSELEAFHSKVNTHFEKTAELFNHVSDSYQSLYDHMAKSSNQLCASQTFQVLPKTSDGQIDTSSTPATNMNIERNKTDSDLFDADHLYQAHEYRNQEVKEELPEETALKDNKVVEIASAKENQDAQALDYAIKKKGVINHNSLDIEGVKSST